MDEPESMDEIIYFTNRGFGEGHLKTWVFRGDCPDCGKKMGKPIVKGKVKIRAKEYVCYACGHTEEKQEHEEKLTACIKYICPYCKHEGDIEIPYKRKSFHGVKALVFECASCKEKIPVTKKMKKPKE